MHTRKRIVDLVVCVFETTILFKNDTNHSFLKDIFEYRQKITVNTPYKFNPNIISANDPANENH
jgi:hypothetical protein